MHKLTKSDFLLGERCIKELWLKHNKRAIYDKYFIQPSKDSILFIKDGYEIERYAKKLFPNIQIGNIQHTEVKKQAYWQPTIETDKFLIRADILVKNKDNSLDIYEIKSASEVKLKHIKDVFFQKFVLEEAGYKVKNCYLVYLNKDFILDTEVKDIDSSKLLKTTNINDEVASIVNKLTRTPMQVYSYLHLDINYEEGTCCDCVTKTRGRHCDTFEYFNGKKKKGNIYSLSRISEKKINELLSMKVKFIGDIAETYTNLTPTQHFQIESAKQNISIIKYKELKAFLDSFNYPLYFLDYEAIAFAVPRIKGTKPREQIVFQYSLHILNKDLDLEHKEFILDNLESKKELVENLLKDLKDAGNVVVWHKQYENTRNKEFIVQYPEYAQAINKLICMTIDLQDVFKRFYFDYKLEGYTSIKKVLPFMCSEFSYTHLQVQNGIEAQICFLSYMEDNSEKLRNDLLKYCHLDTLAMVEIYKNLIQLINNK